MPAELRLRRLRRGTYTVDAWLGDHWSPVGSAYSLRQALRIARARAASGIPVRVHRTLYSTGIR